MKKIFLFAAAVAMFTACSNSDEVAQAPQVGQSSDFTQGDVAVGFDAYAQRATAGRRAGSAGTLDYTFLATEGFGVFGYYTDNNDYDQTAVPNFMYNQHVTCDDSGTPADPSDDVWSYTPVKYWPNEYGTSAISEDQDRISFFAYAPYVNVTPTTGKISGTSTTGIMGITRNSAAGDPLIKYVVDLTPANCVDLVWGVCQTDDSWTPKEGTAQGVAGLPWTNILRPGVDAKMKFQFNHALSQLAVKVKVDANVLNAAVNLENNDQVSSVPNTKVFIRSITFTGFATRGALNLNNNDAGANIAKWLSYDGTSEIASGQETTIYDGRKDGKEGTTADGNEKVKGLNDAFVQDATWTAKTGVTSTLTSLFATDAPIYVIPTGEDMYVTIVYDVLTKDGNLVTYLNDGTTPGSVVRNTIKQKIVLTSDHSTALTLANGKSYTLNLVLGLNSVDFTAAVTDWVTGDAVDDANLPEN